MAQIKGWKKVKKTEHETIWKSTNGKRVEVHSAFIPTKSGGHGWVLEGTNHINMAKYSYSRKPLENKAMGYMKKTLGITPKSWKTVFYNKPKSKGGVKIGQLITKRHTAGSRVALNYFNNVINKNKKYSSSRVVVDCIPIMK